MLIIDICASDTKSSRRASNALLNPEPFCCILKSSVLQQMLRFGVVHEPDFKIGFKRYRRPE